MKTCIINCNSQYDQSPPANIYALPRFRVSLVRENRAAAPSMPISTSVTAAALLVYAPPKTETVRRRAFWQLTAAVERGLPNLSAFS